MLRGPTCTHDVSRLREDSLGERSRAMRAAVHKADRVPALLPLEENAGLVEEGELVRHADREILRINDVTAIPSTLLLLSRSYAAILTTSLGA
eukprot:scaffold626556_cov36-Prasinocladus_malaysianus.AAC.1